VAVAVTGVHVSAHLSVRPSVSSLWVFEHCRSDFTLLLRQLGHSGAQGLFVSFMTACC